MSEVDAASITHADRAAPITHADRSAAVSHADRRAEATHSIADSTQLWTPAQLGDDLALWLDAQDESTLTKSDVDADGIEETEVWGDKSGNGNDAVQTQESLRFEYITDGIGGYASLRSDGVDDYMDSTGVTVSQPDEIFVVVQLAESVGGSPSLYDGINSRQHFFDAESGASPTMFAGSSASINITLSEKVYLWGATFDGGTSSVRFDGNTVVSSVDPDTNNLDGLRLAQNKPLNNANELLWGDVVVIDRALTTTEREKIQGWSAHKYDRTDLLSNDHPYKDSPPTV